MFTKNIITAGALVAMVAAVPMQHHGKRDIIYETKTELDIVTMDVTTTVWLNPGETPPAHYGHHHHKSTWTSHVLSTVTVPAASSAAPAASSQSSPQAASSPASSAVESQSSSYVAPAPSSTEQASAATTAAPAPAKTSTAPAPAATSSSSGPTARGTYTGDLTYYTPGLGSCGITSTASQAIVAVAEDMMVATGATNPNDNPYCGKSITIHWQGKSATATIVDTCPGCSGGSLDLSPSLFQDFAALGVGRLTGATWSFN